MKKGIPFKTWKYEEQTKIKHLVFADYFDKWVKILGKTQSLNYFDCFGGKGAYEEDGEIYFGSPILAAEIIKNNETKLGREVSLIIIDKDKDNLDNIKKILNYKKLKLKPQFINKDFDITINKILDKHHNLAPTFFFVDPFGFKIKISTLKRMLETPKSEILLTFMYNGIVRNLESLIYGNMICQMVGE
jgi:three-Cys-motif partner protein|tara:strand:+ start:105 stop:671 length:567 start_codon:yes stop_codon:yes gene_type:complete